MGSPCEARGQSQGRLLRVHDTPRAAAPSARRQRLESGPLVASLQARPRCPCPRVSQARPHPLAATALIFQAQLRLQRTTPFPLQFRPGISRPHPAAQRCGRASCATADRPRDPRTAAVRARAPLRPRLNAHGAKTREAWCTEDRRGDQAQHSFACTRSGSSESMIVVDGTSVHHRAEARGR